MNKNLIIIAASFILALFGFLLITNKTYACSYPDSCDGTCTSWHNCADRDNCSNCISPRFCVDDMGMDGNDCCCVYQSSHCELSGLCSGNGNGNGDPDPGTVTGRVYCGVASSANYNYDLPDAPLRVLDGGGNLLESTTSDGTWSTTLDNYSMTFTPDSSNDDFSVRSGTSGGNGLYTPVNQRPFCSTAHESCSFSSVEDTTVGGFNFFSSYNVPPGSNACSVPGDSVTFTWDNISQAETYILRVNNTADPWFTAGSDYYMNVPNHPDSSCNPISCSATISTSSNTPFQSGTNYEWWVGPLDADGGYHCESPIQSFSCACNPPNTPTNLSADVPECSDTADTVTLSWDDMPNAESYILEIQSANGTDNFLVLLGACSGGRCSLDYTADPLLGYAWTVYAQNSCGQSTNAVSSFNMDACAVAWMQTVDADLLTRGDIESWIPSGDYLIDNNSGNSPGVAIFGQDAEDDIETHDGAISTTNWNANSEYSFPANRYTYEYFEHLAPRSGNDENFVYNIGDHAGDIDGVALGGPQFFDSKCPEPSTGVRYCWFKYDGAVYGGHLIIDENEVINNKKIILMVDANLQFGEGGMSAERRIQVQEGSGFFMAIVKGNINVLKEYYHSTEIELEGIYFTENGFITEDGSERLHLKGMLAAMGGLNLNRDLGLPGNLSVPSELFEYGPEYIFHFPSIFSNRRTIWREVSP